MKRGIVKGKDVQLAYIDYGGTGHYVILLHGVMSRATNWYDTAQWLREKYHVIAFDQRGHGRSDKPKHDYTREKFVEDIVIAMKELNISNAIIIGHSMGAQIAWCLAIHYPNLVKALVIEDKSTQASSKGAIEEWQKWFHSWPVPFSCHKEARQFFGDIRPTFADHFMELLEERESGYWPIFEFDDIIEILRFSLEKSWWDEIKNIKCPTLIIKGKQSQFKREDGEKMAKIIPKGQFVEIPDASHVVHDDQPELFKEAVNKFLTHIN
ncbi:MAG: alpha/beta fold hydrolase [Candidatus Kariarchaeaceae archaeon]|jgi:pimeloyl-ACP methyl ester carboxylesterase